MSFIGISAGVGAAGLIYSAGKGISQSHQANEIDKNNPRPTYQIPSEFYQNLNIANQLSNIGLPQQQYNQAFNSINQNEATALNALNRSANPGSGVSGVVGQTNQALTGLNTEAANARLDNLRQAMAIRGQLAQQKLAAQQYNLFDKYTEDYNKAASLRTAANGNMQNAFNSASGVLGGLATNYYDNHQNLVPANSNWGANTQGSLNNSPVLPTTQAPAMNIPSGQPPIGLPGQLGTGQPTNYFNWQPFMPGASPLNNP